MLFSKLFSFLVSKGCVDKLPWILTEDGFMQGKTTSYSHPLVYSADSNTIRLINATSAVGQTAWKVGKRGFSLKLNFEKSLDCGGYNVDRQLATAATKFVLHKPVDLMINWTGVGEALGGRFELMTLNIDGNTVISAGSQRVWFPRSCFTAPVSSTPVPPLNVKLNPGNHEIKIILNTVDGIDNSDQSFYQVWFSFSCK
jgi:hypothetical protein